MDFDEKSGIVPSVTSWGRWWQSIDEVHMEVDVPEGTRARDIKCDTKNTSIKVVVMGKTVLEGTFPHSVHGDETIWTLEDHKLLRICLIKTDKTASNVWRSLICGACLADPVIFDQMEQKITLQRFQMENPGMDFSGASISGNYHGGGPQLPMP